MNSNTATNDRNSDIYRWELCVGTNVLSQRKHEHSQ